MLERSHARHAVIVQSSTIILMTKYMQKESIVKAQGSLTWEIKFKSGSPPS